MKTKAQPATPLPWTMDQCSYVYGYVEKEPGVKESRYILGPAPLPMQDRHYVMHAANAYPKLVEDAAESMSAWHMLMTNQSMTMDDVRKMADAEYNRRRAILRELGELS